jgi:translation initiation factor 1A
LTKIVVPIVNRRLKTPNRHELEMYGKVVQLMGVNNIKILCEDGIERNCRIPGKMFKHIWIKPNDIVIVKLWDFQPIKGDVIWRYLNFQVTQLEKQNEMTKLYTYTHDTVNSRPTFRPNNNKRRGRYH